ncbi:molybdopterin-guanine dinucleotide biosynthesis protein B [Parendozoicomonas haliclonae]|uniref:Molybdopterin-guanine dinucleotide biosynthesis adapter protein n=1 Tax=Parendozoicomonas haliclonae TaxID=1960125 RepID=A0A1X7AEN7_9GAMM|nr:molybdopterin-guanine dinucleotide biosynthesis protein B [Parendozoicomonas haliclonae]SMA34638.1 Molybdopterin-guanine dinucleotide biosynthesis adapter protein [Parendozoicomonas haliclonae]
MLLQRPILGFAAFSGTGKTTLLEQVIPLLKQQGLRIGLIKASHHIIEPDKPGKDSYRLRHAGCLQTVLSTPNRAISITEYDECDPSLEDQLSLLDQSRLDLILVEGFRDASIPKIELHRSGFERPFLFLKDNNIIALCCDEATQPPATTLPRLDINQPQQVAEFVLAFSGLEQMPNQLAGN